MPSASISHSFCTGTFRHSGWLLLAVRMPGRSLVKLGSLSAELILLCTFYHFQQLHWLKSCMYCTACANLDYPLMTAHGPPQVCVKGKVYHQNGRLLSMIEQASNFSQIYIHQCTSSLLSGCGMRREIISFLQAGLLRVDPFVQQSGTAAESAQTGDDMELIVRPDTANIKLWSYRDVTAAREVALLPHQPVAAPHDIVVKSRDGCLQCISKSNAADEPFQFPILCFCA